MKFFYVAYKKKKEKIGVIMILALSKVEDLGLEIE